MDNGNTFRNMGSFIAVVALGAGIVFGGSGCELRKRMYDQPRYEPLEKSEFFGDARSARPRVEGTIPRGGLREDAHLYTGMVDGEFAKTYPFPITREALERGRTRFDIYCSPCHDRAGYGKGMVVKRGFKQPTSYHDDRLRNEPPGYFFDAMTKGFGVMPSYAYQLSPEDRWKVAAYIKALQLSQQAGIDDVPEDVREELLAETE